LKMTINQKVRWSFLAVAIATACIAVLGYTQLSKEWLLILFLAVLGFVIFLAVFIPNSITKKLRPYGQWSTAEC
jgi:uncharacterized membrane protein YfcA